MQDQAHPAVQRPIRSYVLRAGRMGTGQQRALAELAPQWVLPFATTAPDWDAVFGRQAPRVLEVGFGMGQATAEMAAAHPGVDFIGVEVHAPGVGALLQRMDAQQSTNLRLIQHDAVQVLTHMVRPASLAGVNLYFPDPWPKKRHHKRRIVQPDWVRLVASRLAPGGVLHCATDWQPYAEHMLAVLAAEPLLSNRHAGYAPRPAHRPLTKFEQRGINLGHGVWDLLFVRKGN